MAGRHGERATWFRTACAFVAGRSTAENHLILEPPHVRARRHGHASPSCFHQRHVDVRSPSCFHQRHVDVRSPIPHAFAALGPLRSGDQGRSTCNQMSIRCQSDAIRCNQCSALGPLSGGCWDWAAQQVPARPSRASTAARGSPPSPRRSSTPRRAFERAFCAPACKGALIDEAIRGWTSLLGTRPQPVGLCMHSGALPCTQARAGARLLTHRLPVIRALASMQHRVPNSQIE